MMNCRGYCLEDFEDHDLHANEIEESLLHTRDILTAHGALSLHNLPNDSDVARALEMDSWIHRWYEENMP